MWRNETCHRSVAYHEPYPVLFVRALQRRTGTPIPVEKLRREVNEWSDEWPQTVGRFLAGNLCESELLAAAEKATTDDSRAAQRCEANFYAAMVRLGAGDTAAARTLFERSISTLKTTFTEYMLAEAERRRFQ